MGVDLGQLRVLQMQIEAVERQLAMIRQQVGAMMPEEPPADRRIPADRKGRKAYYKKMFEELERGMK